MTVGGMGVAVAVAVATGTRFGGVGDAILIILHPAIRTARIAAATAIIQRLMVISTHLSNGVNGLEFSRVNESKKSVGGASVYGNLYAGY